MIRIDTLLHHRGASTPIFSLLLYHEIYIHRSPYVRKRIPFSRRVNLNDSEGESFQALIITIKTVYSECGLCVDCLDIGMSVCDHVFMNVNRRCVEVAGLKMSDPAVFP